MKSRLKWQKLSSARTISGHRPWLSSQERLTLLTRKTAELEARSYFLEAVLLAALRHSDFKSTTSPVVALPTLH